MSKSSKNQGTMGLANKINGCSPRQESQRHNKLLRKLTALGLCAGLVTSGVSGLLAQRTYADDPPTIPYDMMLTKDDMDAVCTAHPNGLLSAGDGTDLKLRIKLGNRPQGESYYSTFVRSGSDSNVEATAPSGDITWLFAGKDRSTRDYVLFAEQPLVGCDALMSSRSDELTSQFLLSAKGVDGYNSDGWTPDTANGESCSGSLKSGSDTTYEVFINHWGGSQLRKTLKSLLYNSESDKGYFTENETNLMKETAIKTLNTKSEAQDTTKDKLYAPTCVPVPTSEDTVIYVGTDNSVKVALANCEEAIWLRQGYWKDEVSSATECSSYVNVLTGGDEIAQTPFQYQTMAVTGAFELNKDNVLFASAAAPSSEGYTQIAANTPMTLRLNGTTSGLPLAGASVASITDDGTVTYSAPAGSRLMVIASDGTNTYQYSQDIAEAVSGATLDVSNLDQIGTFTVKAWIEKDIASETHLTYATSPASGSFTHVPVSSITLTKDAQNVTNGTIILDLDETNTASITATVLPAGAYNSTVTWTSSDDTVATVSDGTITAVAPGVATITVAATDGSGVTATLTVGVKSSDVFIDNTGAGDGSASDNATSLSNALTSCLGGGTIKVNEGATLSSDQVLGNENSAFVVKLQPSGADPISLISSAAESTSALTLRNVELNSGDSTTTQAVEWNSSGDITLLGKVVATIKLGKDAGDVKIPITGLSEGSEVFIVKEEGNSRILSYQSW